MAKLASTSRNPNFHLHARLSHLYQASTVLAAPTEAGDAPVSPALSRFYLQNLRAIAKKSVMRLDPSIKRTICKRCDSLLVPGVSSTHRIENPSKGGKKSWADVLVVECNACGAVKRFPVGIDILKEKRGKKFKLWSEAGDDPSEANAGRVKGGEPKKQGRQPKVFKAEGLALPLMVEKMEVDSEQGAATEAAEPQSSIPVNPM